LGVALTKEIALVKRRVDFKAKVLRDCPEGIPPPGLWALADED
jgi:hypothetical protein